MYSNIAVCIHIFYVTYITVFIIFIIQIELYYIYHSEVLLMYLQISFICGLFVYWKLWIGLTVTGWKCHDTWLEAYLLANKYWRVFDKKLPRIVNFWDPVGKV